MKPNLRERIQEHKNILQEMINWQNLSPRLDQQEINILDGIVELLEEVEELLK